MSFLLPVSTRLSAGILSAALLLSGAAIAQTQSAMTLEIPVLPEAQRYIALLEYPPYLALALDNIGVKLTGSGSITIPDANTLKYNSMVLHYVHQSGSIYSYEASLGWGIGTLPIEVDLSKLDKGKINMRIFLRGAGLLPQDITNRIQLKIQRLADVGMQRKLLAYFDDLQKNGGQTGRMEGIFNLILVQAYNNQVASIGGFVYREPDDAGPLPDLLLLLITLTFWLVIVPLVVAGPYLWRKYRRRPLN